MDENKRQAPFNVSRKNTTYGMDEEIQLSCDHNEDSQKSPASPGNMSINALQVNNPDE